MTLKLISLDVDGTLLNDDRRITPKTYEILMACQQEGIKIVLCSGRPFQGLQALADQLQLDHFGGYLAGYNGGRVYDIKNQKTLFSQTISAPLARKIYDHLEQFEIHPFLDVDAYMYVNDAYADIGIPVFDFPSVVAYEARNGHFKICEVDHIGEKVPSEGVYKILLAGNPDYLKENYQEMAAPFLNETISNFSAPFYFEFTAQGIDKANSLEKAFKPLGFHPDDIIAFGDNGNDITMLQYAGVGVAMGNATDEVKATADIVTSDNNQDGIAMILENYL
ncbi:Cof-type HAD-IIB family hydrolase [Allofustis seminis]|uniref:Cof-type HAD-IIB family hydrolase n=1 Tax=Allofustis seminis TaxID=166939 RepID=UPI0003797F09|nr:Cof-type HAD-IIB family hydrolase [Allofustis seminis]